MQNRLELQAHTRTHSLTALTPYGAPHLQRQGSLPHRPHSDSSLIGSPPMNQRGLRGLDLAQRIPQLRRGILSPVKSVRVPDGVVVTASTAVSREYAVYLASVRASRKPAPPPFLHKHTSAHLARASVDFRLLLAGHMHRHAAMPRPGSPHLRSGRRTFRRVDTNRLGQ